MKRKPKYRVGQVVIVRDKWQHQRYAFKIWGVRPWEDPPEYWDFQGDFFSEVALRPLTQREIGHEKGKNMIYFKVLDGHAAQGLKCAICRKDGSRTQIQNMSISFADGGTSDGSVEVCVHFSCLVEAANNARGRFLRNKKGT